MLDATLLASKGEGMKGKDAGGKYAAKQWVTLRVTEYEKKRLEEEAAVAGLSVSAYMRRRFSGGRPILAYADERMIRELRRQGGLLKSNFGTLREAGASPELLEYMEELLRRLGQVIERIAAGGDDR
jgi:hypothetical protein